MKYWLGKNGQQLGPYELADLQKMMAAGEIGSADLVWTQGMAAWAPAFETIQPPAPMSPPPARGPDPAATIPVIPVATQIGQPQPAQPFGQPQYQPAPQFAPQPAPQYAQPQYGQPQFGQPQPYAPQPATPMGAPMAMGGPVPPAMHWALVWVLGAVTLGIFMLVWIFKQANFVRSIDPQSNARTLYLAGIGLEVLYACLAVAGAAMQNDLTPALLGIGGLAALAAAVCIIVAHFKMRSSLVGYYNSAENIGLRLSGVMTFFFNILYFQYHFTRIADWKRTGVLSPQK